MGVLNVTPDSFSDGGRDWRSQGLSVEAAVARGLELRSAGADIVDVGGESTRPGADPISAAEEVDRVLPVVAALAAADVVASIDTMKPEVALAAVSAGAEIVNDVGGLRDPGMLDAVAETGAGVVIMHMRGEPATMQGDTHYGDVVADVSGYLEEQALLAEKAGILRSRICLDPGIGFGKSHRANLALLANVDHFAASGLPIMIGASRKGFLGSILEAAGLSTLAEQRDPATSATVAVAILAGAAVVRVHDVPASLQVARTTDAIVRGHFENEERIGRS